MTDEKGVGSLPDAGTIKPGDPGHIETHDEMARLMQVAADSLGIILDPPAPKPAVIGEYGHVDAHNTLLANIEQLAAAGGGGLPGELPGLGGWAEIESVTGSPKRYAYNDGKTDWVAFEWTADGEVTTSGGLVDVFMVSGGAGDNPAVARGNGGPYQRGLVSFPTDPVTVDVGRGGASGNSYAVYVGHESSLSANSNILMLSAAAGCSNLSGGATSADAFRHVTDDITGPERTYSAAGGNNHPSGTGIGDGGPSGRVGSDGVVIVRVPAAQAAGVDPGSWVTRVDYYAEVTDGIVTDLYQERFYGDDTVRTENGQYASPEQPDDLIPCDPSVAEGWTYDGKQFTPPPPPPPPTREELIAELQARMDELTKDKK